MLIKMINGKAVVQPKGTKVSANTPLYWVITRYPYLELAFLSKKDVKEFFAIEKDLKNRVSLYCDGLKEIFCF